jgi:adenylate kinase
MDRGELVPDGVIIGMITERIAEPDASDGFMLDGFPRTEPQADALREALDASEREVSAVVLVEVPDEEVVRRLAGRRVCVKNSAHIYHVEFDPPKNEGVCDQDGARLVQRDDDHEDTVRRRLEVYHAQTAPLIDYYDDLDLLLRFDGLRPVEELHKRIRATLASVRMQQRL